MSEQHLTNTKFSSFDLPTEVLQGIDESGFLRAHLWEASLPVALQEKDIAGQAQTGTGKTALFIGYLCPFTEKSSPDHRKIKAALYYPCANT